MQHINEPPPRVSSAGRTCRRGSTRRSRRRSPKEPDATGSRRWTTFRAELQACLRRGARGGGADGVDEHGASLPPPRRAAAAGAGAARRAAVLLAARRSSCSPACVLARRWRRARRADDGAGARRQRRRRRTPGGPVALRGVGACDPPAGDGERARRRGAARDRRRPGHVLDDRALRRAASAARPASASCSTRATHGRPRRARRSTTDTPGFTARIQAGRRRTRPVPRRRPARRRSGGGRRSSSTTPTARYFVVWITTPPRGGSGARERGHRLLDSPASWPNAFVWGLLAASSLVIGARRRAALPHPPAGRSG